MNIKIKTYPFMILSIFILFQGFMNNTPAYSYESNKNIIYFQDVPMGYLLAEGDFWSVFCDVDNTNKCGMSQFIKTNTDDNELSVLVRINKRNNENYMSVIIANIIDIESLEDRLVILTNSKGMNFELNKERCLKNNCEYKISMPQELIDKLIEEDKFIIGIKNIKNNYAIGLLVNLMGFQEMYKLL